MGEFENDSIIHSFCLLLDSADRPAHPRAIEKLVTLNHVSCLHLNGMKKKSKMREEIRLDGRLKENIIPENTCSRRPTSFTGFIVPVSRITNDLSKTNFKFRDKTHLPHFFTDRSPEQTCLQGRRPPHGDQQHLLPPDNENIPVIMLFQRCFGLLLLSVVILCLIPDCQSAGLKRLAGLKRRLRPGLGLGRGLVRAALTNPALKARILKETRQAPGLVAGAIAYGLASLPFLALPLLFASPLAISKFVTHKNEQDSVKITEGLSQILNVASDLMSDSELSNATGINSGTIVKFAQALGLNPTTLNEEPTKPSSSAATAATGDAVFSPGLFSPTSHDYKHSHSKYKQYFFKEGLATTKKPTTQKGSDPDFAEKKSDQDEKEVDAGISAKENLALIAKDVLKTVTEGLKRFELEKTECKERLVCEVSQKYAGSSFKSWATALMHVLDVDTRVEKSKVGKNAVLRTIYRGARSSLNPDKTCADLFPGCV